MKTYQEVEVQLHTLIAAALGGGEWSASGLSHFISRKEPLILIVQEAGWVIKLVWML
jgi:hypothetical protein